MGGIFSKSDSSKNDSLQIDFDPQTSASVTVDVVSLSLSGFPGSVKLKPEDLSGNFDRSFLDELNTENSSDSSFLDSAVARALVDNITQSSSYQIAVRHLSASFTDEQGAVYRQCGGGPLHQAAMRCDLDEVRALIAAGVDPNTADNACAYTALHMAACGGNPDMIQLLLDAGASVFAVGKDGKMALTLANEREQKEACEVLEQHWIKTVGTLFSEENVDVPDNVMGVIGSFTGGYRDKPAVDSDCETPSYKA